MKIDQQLLKMIAGAAAVAVLVIAVSFGAGMILYSPEPADSNRAYPIAGGEPEAVPEPAPEETEATVTVTETVTETVVETVVEPEEPAVTGLAALLAAADADAGKKVFGKCKACHGLDKGGKNKVGPNLWDIVGRPVAGGEGFKYSGALKDIGGNWSYEALDAFLASPKTFAKGTRMSFSGVKDETDRANLIAWMRTFSDNPAALP
jgi:cytochrome c